MIELRFTGESAADILKELNAFVSGTKATIEAVKPEPAKVVKIKPDAKAPDASAPEVKSSGTDASKPEAAAAGDAPKDAPKDQLSEEAIKAERIVIRALVDERTKIDKPTLEKVRALLSSMPQQPKAANVSTLEPANFAAFKEKLLEIKMPEKK